MKKIELLAERLLACRKNEQSVYLYPHVNIDGDALGSALALLLVLDALGIHTCLPLDEPVPPKLDFLPGLDRITWLHDLDQTTCHEQTLALLIDCSEPSRLGNRSALCENARERWVLDHHIARHLPGAYEIVDIKAAAAAEIVHDLIRALESQSGHDLLDRSSAILLMTALISDTGGFVFSNTTKRSFAIASDLMEDDLDLRQITYRLFHRSSLARLRLMGRIFSEARFSHGGKIVLASVGQELMQDCNATDDDLDGIIGYLRNVSGVEMAMILRLQPDGAIRANIRSGPTIDAAAFAGSYGGGGHPRAAGMTLTGMSLEMAAAAVLQKAGELL
ncbi:MAG: DHH family phosphoesterase [Bacillota bacterium]|nr:DHH family phosphoesterase [Bacillota bacterium]